MKKTLLIILGLCVLAAGTAFAQVGTLKPFDLVLKPDSGSGDFQGFITDANMLGGVKLTKGAKYSLKIVFTVSRDVSELNLAFIDNTQAANWWRNLSNWPSYNNIKAGQTQTLTIDFTIDADATGTSVDANKLLLVGKKGSGDITVKFTEFVLTKK